MALNKNAWLAVALWPLAVQAGDPALDQTVDCMRANIPSTVRIQTIEVQAWDRTGGERRLKGKLYGTRENDRVRVMMRIEAPNDLAGASYLVREGSSASDEMYLYLPAVQKVRRLTGASLDGQLWGTDLSYNDVKQIQNAFSGSDVKLEGTGQIESRDVRILSFTPGKAEGSRYRNIRTQVDTKSCVALLVEFFDPAGVRKTMTVKPADLKQSGAHWYASEAEIRDIKNGTHTRIKVTGVTAGDKLAGRYFSPQTFYLGN
jgi:hypothetical protein